MFEKRTNVHSMKLETDEVEYKSKPRNLCDEVVGQTDGFVPRPKLIDLK